MSFEAELQQYQERVQRALDQWLPASAILPARLHEAMRYAINTGGKRIRPALVYGTGRALGLPLEVLDGPACAVEIIHTYSLVHDDLPAMDNDDLRRGKPTCHKAYDEATAILVGDALQALAFYVLSHDTRMVDEPRARLRMIETLALASGSRGMVGGQAMDLAAVGSELTESELEAMHVHKTGALIRSSVLLAALSRPSLDAEQHERLDHYAKCVGLAFQIQDDVLDVVGDTDTTGKTQGADQLREKPTYPSIIGLDRAKQLAHQLHTEALDSLKDFDDRAGFLREIANYIVTRLR